MDRIVQDELREKLLPLVSEYVPEETKARWLVEEAIIPVFEDMIPFAKTVDVMRLIEKNLEYEGIEITFIKVADTGVIVFGVKSRVDVGNVVEKTHDICDRCEFHRLGNRRFVVDASGLL